MVRSGVKGGHGQLWSRLLGLITHTGVCLEAEQRKGNKLAASSGAGGFHVGVCFIFKASAGEDSAFQPVHVPLVSNLDVFVFSVGIN